MLYGAAGTWAAAGPATDVPWWAHGTVVLTGVLAGHRVWRRAADGGPGLLMSVYRTLPVLGWSGTYTAGLLSPVLHYPNGWPLLAAGAWTLGMIVATPWTRSLGLRRVIEQLPEQAADQGAVVQAAPTTFEGHVAAMWADSRPPGRPGWRTSTGTTPSAPTSTP
ncbi:hypothetical protein NKH77_56185 [Streptomyces sp. M19]